jgi:hypothetical protein
VWPLRRLSIDEGSARGRTSQLRCSLSDREHCLVDVAVDGESKREGMEVIERFAYPADLDVFCHGPIVRTTAADGKHVRQV